MVAFPMAVTERTQNRAISIFSYLAGKTAPRRPADFTGVFYAPEYPLDGLGSVSFLQISWIRPSRDMPVSLTQNPPGRNPFYLTETFPLNRRVFS